MIFLIHSPPESYRLAATTLKSYLKISE